MLFVIGNVGVAGSIVFYESLLPHLVGEKELDRVSSAGYAIGYLGGGTLLAINLLMIQKPALFGIPDAGIGDAAGAGERRRLVGAVLDPAVPAACPSRRHASSRTSVPAATRSSPARGGCSRRSSELRRYRDAFVFLLAFLALQRRHPDDDPDGDDLRHRDRPAGERDDHGAAADAVHRRAVRVPVRHGGRAHRRQDRRCSPGWPSTC